MLHRMKRWLRTHPVAGFVVLAFGISYLIGGPVLMLGSGMIPQHAPLLRAYAPRVFVVYGPALAALIMAGFTSAGGAMALLRRWRPSRLDAWMASGIFVAACAIAAVALWAGGNSVSELWRVVRVNGWILFAHFALQFAVVATGEELGWRGWLLPQLMSRMSRLRAALGTGVIWGLWHAPLLISDPGSAIMLLSFVLGLSIVFTSLWVLARARIFTLIVAHASVNAPLFFWEQVGTGTAGGSEHLQRAWHILQAIYIAGALVLVLARWRWWMASDGGDTGVVPVTQIQAASV